jgi:hypothetical protein
MSSKIVSVVSSDFVARRALLARHIFLAEGDGTPGLVRFLSLPVQLAEGDKTSWVTVTRMGTFTDPRYGEFEITRAMLDQMVSNFDKRVLGQEVFFDVAHKPSDGAAARVLKLAVEGTKLRALVEWTAFGTDAVRNRGFAYLSAEYHENWRDNEKGMAHGCVLIGAGLTTRPVIKNLDRVALSAADPHDDDDAAKVAVHPSLRKLLEQSDMNKHLKALNDKLIALGLTEAQMQPLLDAALKQLEAAKEDDAKCLAVVDNFATAGEACSAQIKALAQGGNGGAVTLAPTFTFGAQVSADDVNKLVAKALGDAQAATLASQEQLNAKVKLLSDTIGASKTLSDDDKASITKELQPLVTKELSDDQVKRLAEFALQQASRGSAAAQLALLGYRAPAGSVHITVEGATGIRALQEQVDRRLGLATMPDSLRYQRTGGQLLAQNKAFAEMALAHFDALHGERLDREHKALAGGTGLVSDSAVPVAFERTVLREALYNLTGLSFVDVGTVPFASVVSIPYSYRDTSAAGVNSTRVYESGAIPLAGVIQTAEDARPLPQKLAMRVSNEIRYLLGGSPIDFDPLAENTRNIIRIIGEDTDRLIQNEVLRSADEALSATITDTLTGQVNGTNRIFVTTQFPVVRPRSVFDLQGNLAGSVQNPITVTLNAVARTEYRTGVTLAAGLYWVMDYNMGEIRFVNEAGVLQTPTSAWVLTVQYRYTLNVGKVDLVAVGAEKLGDIYDRVLQSIGSRKVVIENDRYYTANMQLFSGAVDNALGQAFTFQANSARPGTGLNADGSIAVVKGIPAFNTRAPGLDTGDVRIVVGERGNTRFRMMRPFQMTELSEARNTAGNFIGQKEAYGEQFLICHTPTQRKNATTSVVLFSSTARVARAA